VIPGANQENERKNIGGLDAVISHQVWEMQGMGLVIKNFDL